MPAALEDETAESKELCPAAEAMIHGVRVALLGGAEFLEKAVDGVVADVERAAGHEAAVFGKEQEDEAQEDGEKGVVDIVRVARQGVAQECAVDFGVGGLEAADEFVEGFEDLLGESSGDGALVFAALLEQGREALGFVHADEPAMREEHLERGGDGSPGQLGHEADGEGEAAGVLAARGVEEADFGAIGEDADGDVGGAQKALEFLRGRGDPAGSAGFVGDGVEVGSQRKLTDEKHPRPRGIGRNEVAISGVRPEQLAVVASGDAKGVGDFVFDGVDAQKVSAPAEELLGEVREAGDDGRAIVGLLDGLDESLLCGAELRGIELCAEIDEGDRRNNDALGLEVADPAFVLVDGVFPGVKAHDNFSSSDLDAGGAVPHAALNSS